MEARKEKKETRKLIEVPRLAVSKRFGKYKDENPKSTRLPDVRKDRDFDKILNAWKKYNRVFKGIDEFEGYEQALVLVEDLRISGQAVEKFIISLLDHQKIIQFDFMAGLFLSALINSGKGRQYFLDARLFDNEIDHIGSFNEKEIIIKGNVGVNTGSFMKSGSIMIHGNAKDGLGGGMDGGKIKIFGNTEIVGNSMDGGMIIVYGDATCAVGDGMRGGEIRVDGEIGSIGEIEHGKIFHKGKLIVDK